ncbi:MBL fold metallo-hydrolase [Shewanella submarina]|uniref:MBL fold metallo-hydrolase n=1 Tax=Shewanella submarina TaxID=2016376 RepID=A0ABV7GAZ4_9GAMM|nr:MBL fold metallo-hydrolase [Shewanella submarina]MCL1037426.1 MBL fold metallo-hydrolase [Shewanella submarina]
MDVQAFYHETSGTFTYVVSQNGEAMIIDPVLDIDGNDFDTHFADKLIDYLAKVGARLKYLLETHIHADHLSAAPYLRSKLGGLIGIGKGVEAVYSKWEQSLEGKPLAGYDLLLDNHSQLMLGGDRIGVIATPGHTESCVSYLIKDALFVGDLLMSPSKGTGRADFPGGSVDEMFASVKCLYQLPDQTRVYLCHDYPGEGNDAVSDKPLSEHKRCNVMLNAQTTAEGFKGVRTKRDAGLAAPRMLDLAVPFNLTYCAPRSI